jgi:hypothetical protein
MVAPVRGRCLTALLPYSLTNLLTRAVPDLEQMAALPTAPRSLTIFQPYHLTKLLTLRASLSDGRRGSRAHTLVSAARGCRGRGLMFRCKRAGGQGFYSYTAVRTPIARPMGAWRPARALGHRGDTARSGRSRVPEGARHTDRPTDLPSADMFCRIEMTRRDRPQDAGAELPNCAACLARAVLLAHRVSRRPGGDVDRWGSRGLTRPAALAAASRAG